MARLPWKLRNKVDPDWAFLKEKLNKGLELRRPYEAQWVLNLAFLAGRQYSFFNMTSHSLHEIPKQVGQIMAVDNIILPKWRRQVSNLIKAQPRIAVAPNSTQEEDILAAKLGTKILDHYYTRRLMKSKGRQLAGWIYSTGNAFLSDLWNKKIGPMSLSKKEGRIVYDGDVDSSVWGPFDLVFPLYHGATDIQELDWVMVRKRKSLEWIKENLQGGDAVNQEEISHNAMTVENLFMTQLGIGTTYNTPSAYMIWAYFKPSREFPNGAFFRACNGVVEPRIDWPFGEFPIAHFKDIEVPNQLMGASLTEHAIPLQIRWNDCINSIAEFNKEVAKVKISVPRGSKLEVVPDGNHRELVEYKPILGHAPQFLQPYSIPPSVEHELATINMSMENLYSQHEVTRGTNKSDIRSGEMVDLLLEQDAYGNIPSSAIFEEAMEAHCGRILARVQVGYKEDRIIKIGNTEDDFEVLAFKGTDLRNNRDVKIVPGSSMPDSIAARHMQVERRFGQGLFGNPADPKVQRRTLRMLDESIVDDVYSDWKKDEEVAAWENRQLVAGKQLMINTYDNHGIHQDSHNNFRKSLRFQRLKIENPQLFEQLDLAIQAHNSIHQSILQEEMKKQIQLMQAQGGKNG